MKLSALGKWKMLLLIALLAQLVHADPRMGEAKHVSTLGREEVAAAVRTGSSVAWKKAAVGLHKPLPCFPPHSPQERWRGWPRRPWDGCVAGLLLWHTHSEQSLNSMP